MKYAVFQPIAISLQRRLISPHTAIPRSLLRTGDGCAWRDAFVTFMRMAGICL